MSGATIKTAQRAITEAGLPLELVRGDGYHYFIYDRLDLNIYETRSVMEMYTSHLTPARWAEHAQDAWGDIQRFFASRGVAL